MKKTSIEHDFSDHDQMATPLLPTDSLGAAGFMMCEAITLIAQANRRGALLRRFYARDMRSMSAPREYWDDDFRILIEATEAELNLPSPNMPGDKT
jgi:hypothetical protein